MARMNNAMHDLFKYNAGMLPKKRSTFNRSKGHATTFDSGYLIPIYLDDILPGDEVKIRLDSLVRMATPIHPTMDSAYVDFFAFYCPNRIVWDNYKKFYGENLEAEYNEIDEYKIPSFRYENNAPDAELPWTSGSLFDYMGLPSLGTQPTLLTSEEISVLPFRMYQKIYNDWFRASEIQPSVMLNYGDTVTSSEIENGVFELRKVNKLHDYFTSLLPYPQAGDSVLLPLGDTAPIITKMDADNGQRGSKSLYSIFSGTGSADKFVIGKDADEATVLYQNEVVDPVLSNFVGSVPTNLVADLTSATSATINDLRVAITVQQALERDALGGLRYSSIIHSHWGILTPDDVLQRPQLLGQARNSVGMRSVPQTAQTNDGGLPGELGAFSATRFENEWLVNNAFTEPGYIMILCCVRPIHTYSQGYPEHFRKLSRFDHYLPVFDNIGNQPVYTNTILAYDEDELTTVDSNRVLGYKPAWDEYKTALNSVAGLMRPDVEGSLASWNYADDYISAPTLSSDFISEDKNLIGRTIAVQNQPQFIADMWFDVLHTRNMGVRALPGLTRF